MRNQLVLGTQGEVSAERSLICALFIDASPTAVEKHRRIAAYLRPDDFAEELYGGLYACCLEMIAQGVPIDCRSVFEHFALTKSHKLSNSEIIQLAEDTKWYIPVATHAEYYAQQILERSISRRTARLGASMEFRRDDFSSAFQDVQDQLADACARHEKAKGLRDDSVSLDSVSETATAFLDALSRDGNDEDGGGVGSPLERLDEYIGGRMPTGTLAIVGAVPGTGKTLFLLQALMRAAKAGRKCVLISQEMGVEMIGERFVAMLTGAGRSSIGVADVAPLAAIVKAELQNCDIRFEQTAPTGDAITAVIRRHADNGATVFAIDYLQLLQGRGKTRYEQITDVCSKRKSVTSRANVFTWLASQLNREALKTKPPVPQLYHLRDSGQIEADADFVFMLRHPRKDSEEAEVIRAMEKAGVGRCLWTDYYEIYIRKVRNRPLPIGQSYRCKLSVDPLRLESIEDEREVF